MYVSKLKKMAAVLLLVGIVACGGGLLQYQLAAGQETNADQSGAAPATPKAAAPKNGTSKSGDRDEVPAGAPQTGKTDLESIQGAWVVVSGERFGEKLEESVLKREISALIFKEQVVIWRKAIPHEQAQFVLNPQKMPKEIDVGSTRKGIYELHGDVLKICFNQPWQGSQPAAGGLGQIGGQFGLLGGQVGQLGGQLGQLGQIGGQLGQLGQLGQIGGIGGIPLGQLDSIPIGQRFDSSGRNTVLGERPAKMAGTGPHRFLIVLERVRSSVDKQDGNPPPSRKTKEAPALDRGVPSKADDPMAAKNASDGESAGKLVVQVYSVADLVTYGVDEELEVNRAGALTKVITRTVDAPTWDVMGGAGSIEYFPGSKSLVVSQTASVQARVQALLVALEKARAALKLKQPDAAP